MGKKVSDFDGAVNKQDTSSLLCSHRHRNRGEGGGGAPGACAPPSFINCYKNC